MRTNERENEWTSAKWKYEFGGGDNLILGSISVTLVQTEMYVQEYSITMDAEYNWSD